MLSRDGQTGTTSSSCTRETLRPRKGTALRGLLVGTPQSTQQEASTTPTPLTTSTRGCNRLHEWFGAPLWKKMRLAKKPMAHVRLRGVSIIIQSLTENKLTIFFGNTQIPFSPPSPTSCTTPPRTARRTGRPCSASCTNVLARLGNFQILRIPCLSQTW